jgi:hypothetical protein
MRSEKILGKRFAAEVTIPDLTNRDTEATVPAGPGRNPSKPPRNTGR